MSQRFVDGEVLQGEDCSVALVREKNDYGDTFYFVGKVTDHTEDGEVLRTREEAYAYAARRGWLPQPNL